MRSAVLCNGAVAQLGERQNRTLEVGGSTPLCSTIYFIVQFLCTSKITPLPVLDAQCLIYPFSLLV